MRFFLRFNLAHTWISLNSSIKKANRKDTPDLKKPIQSIPYGATKEAVQAVLDRLVDHERQTDERFADLADFTERLDSRLREQERYTRKNSVIIDNPPFDAAKPTAKLLPKFLEFLNKLYKLCDVTITESRLTAFHILPGPEKMPADITPSVIVSFTHFRGKDEVYKNRRMLKHMFNSINNRKVWMKETLPPLDSFVETLARSRKLIAVTKNSEVSRMCKNNKGENVFVRVNNALDVNNLKNPVIRDDPNLSGANAVKLKANQVVAQKRQLDWQEKEFAAMSPEEKTQHSALIDGFWIAQICFQAVNFLLLTIQGSDN